MMSEQDSEVAEWVEIVEPTTKKHLFANLETGDCCWNVPLGAKVKKYSDESDHWWELFDKETKRFYYYNVSMQKTVWKKPLKGDIIPLMKLQNLETAEDIGNVADPVPSTDIMRRDHRRTASARYSRDTSAPGALSQRSSRNQSQRKARGDQAGQSHPAVTDVPSFEQNSSKPRLSRSEKRDEPQHWLSRSFDQGNACASGSTSTRDVIPDSKRSSSNQISSRASNGQSNFGMTGCHDGQRAQPHSFNELCSFSDEPRRRIRAGNSSIDSGITTDVSCAPYEASCISLPNASSSDHHLNCDGTQFSRIGCCEPLQEMAEMAPVLSSVQMTPGSQRRAFPRTNPKIASGQKVSGQRTGHQTDQVLNAMPDFGTANNLLLDQEVLRQNSSSSNREQVDGAVFSQMRYKTDRGEESGRRIPDSVPKSTCGIRRSADSATCETSFSFRKFPPDSLNPSTSANRTFRSVSSTSSNEFENGRTAPNSALKQNSSGIGVRDVSEKPAQKQPSGAQFIVEEDRLEECRRTRRNSEPDYANLQEVAAREEAMAAVKNNSADRDFSSRTQSVRAKAEPVYANEQLTGRGCLTHEDRYHLPSFTGNRDGSLGSTGSSTISTPSPKMQKRATHLSRETRHMSLRRKKLAEKPASQTSKSFVDKSRSLHSELIYQRPVSMAVPVDPDVDSIVCQVADTLMLRADMEQFMSENLNMHRKGLLGKTVPIGNMLVWTKDPIQKPMIRTDNRVAKKEAPEVFKLIQTYMGDRKSKETEPCVAMELANKGWSVPELRDEIYVQLCRQTTKNPRDESLLNGWELLGICLSFFPPSAKFQLYLEGHICQTQESHDHTEGSKLHVYAVSCMRRLDKICQTGAARKPTQDDLERVRKSLLQPSMFGSTLDDVMDLQKELFPAHQLPWIQVTLSEALLNFRGNRMPEGIFRVPGDVDEVNALQEKLDRWTVPSPRTDPHVLASVLKLWYRELYEPLIPDEFYDECVENFDNPNGAIDLVNELPSRHKLVLTYLIKFLQKLASPEYSAITKMDASNLAMVMAPNCLRCNASNPQLMFENARKEMVFLRTLIQNLDASSIDCIK